MEASLSIEVLMESCIIPKNGDVGLKIFMDENEHSLPSVSDYRKKIETHASNVEDS